MAPEGKNNFPIERIASFLKILSNSGVRHILVPDMMSRSLMIEEKKSPKDHAQESTVPQKKLQDTSASHGDAESIKGVSNVYSSSLFSLSDDAGDWQSLNELQTEAEKCTKCGLAEGRTHVVFGEGSPNADLMFIGEAPGFHEDVQGRPFVGRAGNLLTKMIEAMGYVRDQVYIGNIIKCRPPENRNPNPDEVATCIPYLQSQIAFIKPRVIVALGSVAVQALLDTKIGITKLRGEFHDYRGVPLLPTYHPAYLLRNPAKKKEAWEDLKQVIAFLSKVRDD